MFTEVIINAQNCPSKFSVFQQIPGIPLDFPQRRLKRLAIRKLFITPGGGGGRNVVLLHSCIRGFPVLDTTAHHGLPDVCTPDCQSDQPTARLAACLPVCLLVWVAYPSLALAGQDRAGQGRAGQGRAGQGRAGQGRAPFGPEC